MTKTVSTSLTIVFFSLALLFSGCTSGYCIDEPVKEESSKKEEKKEEDKDNDKDTDDKCDTEKGKESSDKNGKKAGSKEEDKDDEKGDDSDEPLKMGNLTLPGSQQPGPLLGLGENIIDEGESQFFLYCDDFLGRKKFFIDVVPSYLYGITDNLSVSINFPIAPKYGDGPFYSSGLQDFFAQFEYAYYNKNTKTYTDQATVLGSFFVTTGSNRKAPNTGFGPCFFLGGTYSRTGIEWFGFTSVGAIITGRLHGDKGGNNYFYECGFGRNICYMPEKWIFSWMVEINGLYTEKNIATYRINPDSGGNVIYINPSLWYSTKEIIVQLGFGYAAIQHVNGWQNKEGFLALLNIGWTLPYQQKGEWVNK